jgi:hypothetical protein
MDGFASGLHRRRTYLGRVSRAWDALARRRRFCILLAAAIPLVGRLILLTIQPIPVPATGDEFSYLLAADTFASGHLTNPTPPMWEHFETFHELMRPTYMSVYPPAQGALLAIGKILSRHPWWGVWASIGVMCAALTWMLQAWLPLRWALLGGVLAGLQFGFEHYWMNEYWGGSVAAVGGCLALGAVGYLRRRTRVAYSIVLGIGLAVLATSRPFEGFVLTLVLVGAGLVLGRKHYREPGFLRRFVVMIVLPAVAFATIGGIALATEARAVTGSPFKMPYELYRHQEAVWPVFLFERPRTNAVYRHEVLRKFFEEWEPEFEDGKDWGTLRGLIPGIEGRLRMVGACYFPLAPYLPIALLSLVAVSFRKTRLLGAAICASLAANGLATWMMPHYLAPILGAMMAIHLQFLRFVRTRTWRGRPLGRWVFAGVLVFLMVLFAIRIEQRARIAGKPWALDRARMLNQLEAMPGEHLILVEYQPNHVLSDEWVFNGPDIPAQKVIWARSMTPDADSMLVKHFPRRTVWMLEADASPPRLAEFRRTGKQAAP